MPLERDPEGSGLSPAQTTSAQPWSVYTSRCPSTIRVSPTRAIGGSRRGWNQVAEGIAGVALGGQPRIAFGQHLPRFAAERGDELVEHLGLPLREGAGGMAGRPCLEGVLRGMGAL